MRKTLAAWPWSLSAKAERETMTRVALPAWLRRKAIKRPRKWSTRPSSAAPRTSTWSRPRKSWRSAFAWTAFCTLPIRLAGTWATLSSISSRFLQTWTSRKGVSRRTGASPPASPAKTSTFAWPPPAASSVKRWSCASSISRSRSSTLPSSVCAIACAIRSI